MLKVINDCKAPERATKYSAGIDLFASEDCIIAAGETKIIGLGVCIDLDSLMSKLYTSDIEYKKQTFMTQHYLELHPRSSLRAKGLISGVGVIDLDYADEIKIIITNSFEPALYNGNIIGYAENTFKINKGDKIAQILLKEHKSYLLGVESNEKRVGGFGSSGDR